MAGVKRLSKVARELNVGISTIVEFLDSKGNAIEASPNTKIDEGVYNQLLEEFQASKSVKEKAQEASIQKKEERISLTLKKEEEAKEEIIEEPIVVETPKEEKEEVKQEEKATPAPIAETPVETPTPAPEVIDETPTEAAPVEKKKGPSVVGKIDLDSINSKTKPAKKSKKKEEPKKAEKPEVKKEEPKKVEKPEVKKVEPVEIETIKVNTAKLTGPSVVGKIELPVEKPKKPKVNPNDEKRNKRKRIKKVNVNIEKAVQKATRDFKKGKGKPALKKVASEGEISKEIKETLARLSGKGKSKGSKFRRDKRQAVQDKLQVDLDQQEAEKSIIKVTEFVTVSELATMMDKSPTDIIATLMSIGVFASINQRLDAENLSMVAEEYGFTVEFVNAEVAETIDVAEDNPDDLIERSPIVTVMGHVDHGKTSLLDHIRSANVTEGEAGGITQHIGAYSVTGESGRKVTFLDTPGHEAFTAMRARGAQVTDIAIIIIAADDQIMPQTEEAINHAQAAGVPMVFAFNKIDKPGANADKIREQLATKNILVEDWGGKYQCQEISAKNGIGIDELLEKVLLESDMLELKANPNKNAIGTVIESSLDIGRGYVTTLLVEAGTLKIGDTLVAGTQSGKIKAMHNDKGENVKEAGPSIPVSVLGMNGASTAGDTFNVLDDEKEVKAIATRREQLQREQGLRTQKTLTLDEIGRRLALGDFKELNIIVKGDVDGSIEALSDSLIKLSTDQIQVNIIHKAVGQISESDVLLATASDAIIIGFQVRPSAGARRLAEEEQVDIRLYSIIYKAIEEIKDAMEGMLSPDIIEEILGSCQVRETFKITKIGTIAGCLVTDGKITRSAKIRLIRDGIVIYTGLLGSLKRFKDDVKEVTVNYECGLNIEKYNDIKVDDVIEAYHEVEVAKKL